MPAVSTAVGSTWNLTTILSAPILLPNRTLEELQKKGILVYHDMGCLFNAIEPHKSTNHWHVWDGDAAETVTGERFVKGTTIWINEHMSVGHMMYDLYLLEALRATKVDRVILQRAPCMNADLCVGNGTWRSYFQTFYSAAFDAFQPGVPLYFRFEPKKVKVAPIYLSLNNSNIENEYYPQSPAPDFQYKKITCLQRVIKRSCDRCFLNGISQESVVKFKNAAYKAVKSHQMNHTFTEGSPINVLLAHRGFIASRHILNIQYLIDHLQKNLPSPQFNFQVKCTSHHNIDGVEQMKMVAEAQIVIAEHGGFQSNLVYMRDKSLFVELRGNYTHGEFSNFDAVAKMFGVFTTPVITNDLRYHKSKSFNISSSEAQEIVAIIRKYAVEAPFK